MEIFNATNLLYIWGGFVKTIEISALSIFSRSSLARCWRSSRAMRPARSAFW